MQIIGVTGTNGSGKGTFVRFLEELGYAHYSARELILEEIEKRGLSDDRNAMQIVGNDLRKLYGPDYIPRELIRRATEKDEAKIIVESVRALGEVHFLKEKGAKILAVDDPVSVRYERIVKRAHSTDRVTLDEFIAQEQKECTGTEEWDRNIPLCIGEADFVFMDNGSSEQFREKVFNWLKNIE